jgi:hypothetical protein
MGRHSENALVFVTVKRHKTRMALPKPLTLWTAIVLAFAFGHSARAINYDWTGAVDSDWLNPGNWTPAGPAQGGNDNFARFTTVGTNQPVISADVPVVQDYLTSASPGAGATVITQTAGMASMTGWLRMGALGGSGNVGTYNLTGGTLEATSFRIAEQSGQVATLNISGGTFRQPDINPADGGQWSRLGTNGVAVINLSGTGLMSFDSRVLLGESQQIGTGGVNVTQTGGTFEIRRGEFVLGDGYAFNSATPQSTYRISAGTLQTLRFHQDDNEGGNITIGEWDRSNSLLEVSGTAIVSSAKHFIIGAGRADAPARGTVTQTGGNIAFGGNGQLPTGPGGALEDRSIGGLIMSTDATSNSSYTMSSGTLRQRDMNNVEDQGGWNHIGQNGTATFNLSGDAIVSFSSRTHVGSGGAAVATVNQTGGLFEVRSHDLIIGDAGRGTYNISAGTLQTLGDRTISVGNWSNSTGNLNVSGTAQVSAGGSLFIGQAENNSFNGSGTVTQTGGSVTVGVDIRLGSNSTGANGTYNLNGGVLDMTGGNILAGLTQFGGPGTRTFNMTAGILRNVGSMVGNSTDNTFTQQGGTFEVGAAPGAGGLTTVDGNYSLLAGGTIKIELAAGLIDQLVVNGTVTVAGTLDLDQLGDFTIDVPIILLANDGIDAVIGAFANAPDGVGFTQDGHPYTVFYNGGDGNDIVIIPEPTGLGLMALALASSCGLLRRRRRSG